jgi:penicillin-binding protein 2
VAPPEEQTSALRITLLASVVVLFLVALVSRLWFLQILAGQRFDELSQDQAVRIVTTEAPRGRVLTAGGEALLDNRRSPTVVVDRQVLLDLSGQPRDDGAERVLADLAQLLGTDVDSIMARLSSIRFSPFSPVPVYEDVPREVRYYIQEHQEYFPGVSVIDLPVRTFPQGETAAHLVGYTGEISQAELDDPTFVGYRQGERVGKAGLEKTYETDLQGIEGAQRLSVSARGTVLEVLSTVPPQRGNDLVTSIDLDLQQATERILEAGIIASRDVVRRDGRNLESVAGSAVVLDATDSSVVAMASWPTYDPSAFVDGLTQTEFDAIFDRAVEDEVPALNRAIQGAYPPGSVFKTVSGAAALDAGLISTSSTVPCPSSWQLGSITFNNWNASSEGSMDLATALKRSCDTFFYELAYRQYVREEAALDAGQDTTELFASVAHDFGFGRELGIDLPAEQAGVIPSREWKEDYWERTRTNNCQLADRAGAAVADGDSSQRYAYQLYTELCLDGYRYRGGDAVNASIGQGDVLTTPLQVAASYAAIANGGTLYQPQLGDRIVDADGELVRRIEPAVLGELPVTPEGLAEIRLGLEEVVMGVGGTAVSAFADFPTDRIPVAGKTGTAELGSEIPYAWFASYAPADDPQYVVVVSVERGGGGSQTAAPIAVRILQAAFGLDVTPYVPGEEILD